jgi:hypothetical protein
MNGVLRKVTAKNLIDMTPIEYAIWYIATGGTMDDAEKAAQELANKDAALAEARELLAMFAEQAELISHLACDDTCEYKQAAEWIKKYGGVK